MEKMNPHQMRPNSSNRKEPTTIKTEFRHKNINPHQNSLNSKCVKEGAPDDSLDQKQKT